MPGMWREGHVIAVARDALVRVLAALALALVATAAAAEPAPSKHEWTAIKRVIDAQIVALKKDDGAKAFGYATAGLQAQFGDASTFMRMVHAGYEPLIAARYREFLDGAVVDGHVIQPLRLVLNDGNVLVALYTMEQEKGGRWRIAGCLLAPSTVKAA